MRPDQDYKKIKKKEYPSPSLISSLNTDVQNEEPRKDSEQWCAMESKRVKKAVSGKDFKKKEVICSLN